MLMMYYTTVSGWMVTYFYKFLTGEFQPGMDADATSAVFSNLQADPKQMTFWMVLTVLAGFLVCSRGLQNGLEKVSKFMMTALLLLIVVLAVHSFTLSGAGEGIRICALDTFVAIMSGLIIFPACFSYGVEATAGPKLIFVTLPNVFVHMAGGRIWGTMFFLFMTFASFSTIIAVFENIMSFGMDMFGWSRSKTAVINCVVILIASLPCVLGYNVWSNLHLIGGRDVLDSEDFIVSNLLLPLGSLVYLLFCVTKWGWGFDHYLTEANTGKGLKIARWLKPYFRFVLPILLLIILIQGLV